MPKICLDAGHYGHYNCNRNVSPVYWESLMAWGLHLKLKAELEKYGFEVITTREDEEVDLGVYTRGQKAKGCDLFISLHSNDCETESVDRPVCIYPVDNRRMDLAQQLADCVKIVMQTNDPSRIYCRWNSAHNADYYGVIRGAASVGVPGLIIEHSFHSNNRAAKWLQSDANLDRLAKAEALVLADYFGLKPAEMPFTDVPEDAWYHDSVAWAYENGIVAGTSETTFSPEKPCTRAQIVTMLKRYHDKFGGG